MSRSVRVSNSLLSFFAISIVMAVLLAVTRSEAQVSSGNPPQPVQPQLPITTQIKKTIVFLESDCLHDFHMDAANLTRDKILALPINQQEGILNQLNMLILRFRGIKASRDKLSADEIARLFPQNSAQRAPQTNIPDEIDWRLTELIKMATLSDEEIVGLDPVEVNLVTVDQFRGTGFLVGYSDDRLKPPTGEKTGSQYFRYLVTNRHVAQPGIDKGAPCRLVSSTILLNHKSDATHTSVYVEADRIDKVLKWTFPQDESVDLAVTAIGFDQNQFDHIVIPSEQFVTDEDVKNRRIVEGDPVLFAGLFVQTFDQVHTLEPIVRSGTLAMVPDGELHTTLNNRMGHIYLADAHVFGGNSGSPIFIDPNRFAGIITTSPAFKLLGVISGEMFENSDLTLSVTTSLSGNVAANSGVSMVVPVSELMKLLNDQQLKAQRDQVIERFYAPKAAGQH